MCPNGQELRYATTNKQGYRKYKSNGAKCAGCPLLAQCTQSQNHVKVITRHVWQDYLDQAEAIRLTFYPRKFI
ncbi:transposase [Bhargavaea massiliensis]|uniref:transposase n=1 Tax=Bhargavaea massiliensis TaxID=2697500 RepID=UPI003AF7193B